MHKFMAMPCCPTSDDAAAVVIRSQKFLHPQLQSQAVEIAGQVFATDDVVQLEGSGIKFDLHAATLTLKESDIGPNDCML